MKIYIEGTTTEIQTPDLSKGYTYPGRIKTGIRDVVMDGSVETYPPNGLRHREDVYEDCLFYHEYTAEELAAQQNPPEQPTELDSRVAALETGQADLQEALDLLLSGVTE